MFSFANTGGPSPLFYQWGKNATQTAQ